MRGIDCCLTSLHDYISRQRFDYALFAEKETTMGRSEKLFSTSMFGYSKDEVRFYDQEQKERQSRLENQIALQSERIRSLENLLKAYESEMNVLRARIDEASRQRDAIARVLVDAELRADDIVNEAVKKGEDETLRLMNRADAVREHIEGQIERVRDVEDAADTFAKAIIARLRASADLFEKELLDAVGGASEDAEKVLKETETVLDTDYFESVRKKAETVGETSEAEEETAETDEEISEEDDDEAEAAGIPADYSFQTSDEGKSFFKVIRA